MDDGVQFTLNRREPAISAAKMLFLDLPAFLFIQGHKVSDLIGQAGIDAKINNHDAGS
jgi:hypothetical protein